MREIKFRGKCIEDCELKGQWLYGHYLKSASHFIAVDQGLVDGHFKLYQVDPDTVGQYTGLKDRIGREIYEGDVVKVGMNGAITEVTFEAGSFLTIVGESRYRLGGWETEAVEVLGNRFDHPHLLKGDGNA